MPETMGPPTTLYFGMPQPGEASESEAEPIPRSAPIPREAEMPITIEVPLDQVPEPKEAMNFISEGTEDQGDEEPQHFEIIIAAGS